MDQSHRGAQGILVVNEGSDGSGKETQTKLLCERLVREGFAVHRFSFPTYDADPVAGLIRTMLHKHKSEWNARPWESKAVLYASNRRRFIEEIRKRLNPPLAVVVCDRYVPSNQAHMAAITDDPKEWVRRFDWIAHLEYEMMCLPRADIVLLHTMPLGLSQEFMRARGHVDAHEENAAYLERVVRCFHLLAEREPKVWRHVPADVDSRLQSREDVHARVWEALAVHPAWQAFVQEQIPVVR